ncbi:alpha/beta-hydrolase [Amniculicola lignicola CBS 123094]|uniref:Alpha/beta-hydrolase n=1 Tax=Amniculicola lignicola CBS 123094 TaxID=1392246 RepID=A0A6A5W4R0_9PLEO|nr:alpha/beta-hydrolase [Amniculicola lignicola CBS 123094]
MSPLAAKQPLKALLTILLVLSAPAYIGFHTLLYLPRRLRPRPGWSLKTSIATTFLHLFYKYVTVTQLKPFYANAKKLKDRYVLVPPGPASLYKGIAELDPNIEPVPAPAIWFPKPYNKDEDKLIVIHFQGGAYVFAPDPQEAGEPAAKIFKEKMGATTFYPQYRISRTEDTRFPAALQDAVSFYRYILDQGVHPSNIILSGDSAGGNLVLALLRYIEEHKRADEGEPLLPGPAGAMLWSPWVDIGDGAVQRYKNSNAFRHDFVNYDLLLWGKAAYEPSNLNTAKESAVKAKPYLSPYEYPFHSQTPIFVNAGTAEALYEEIKEFTKKMKDVEGNSIHYMETKDAPHDVILAGKALGFEKEAEDAVIEAVKFFKVIYK